MFSRTERVMGKNNLELLSNCNIAVLGVGGVGGYIAEMMVRLGVMNITIVDFDVIDVSNLNRQIVALNSNIGCYKVEELKKRLLDINPNCKVLACNEKLTKDNVPSLLNQNFNFVIDAIDDIFAKVEIAKFCTQNNINIISSMGTGNRYKQIPQFEVTDVFKTSYDKLAKKFRKLLKEQNITSLTVCYTKQPPEETKALGSVVYYPLMCAGTIVSFVINKLLNDN